MQEPYVLLAVPSTLISQCPIDRRPPERELWGEGLSFGGTAKKWMRRQERERGEKKEMTKTMTKEEQGDAEDKAEDPKNS